jgi:predicted dehydrogenase
VAHSHTPVRVAVVGTGGIARGIHLPALAAMRGRVEIVALVDVDETRVEESAHEFSVAGRYTGIDEMLAAESPDLVVVSTPPIAHKAAAIASLDAGASVWCEKPPALSLAEYDEIASHEGADGPYATYVFQHRFGSAVERLSEHVLDGTLGRPLVGICNTLWFRDPAYFEVPWRGRWHTEGGGPTMGHGIHQMDLLLSVLGDWRDVTSVMMAIVRFESGAMVSIVNSLLSPRETSYLRFDFEHATVEVEHLYGYDNSNWRWTPASHVADPAAAASAWQPADDRASSHASQLESLISSIERGERPRVSGDDGRRSLELIAGMYASAITGGTVLRSDLGPEHPFYASMHGGDPAAATALLASSAGLLHV